MKARQNYLLAISLLLFFTTCKEETDYSEELGNLASTIQNDVAKQFLYQMKNQPGTYQAFQEVLQKDAASFEFTVLSSSPQYGVHYAIPYIQNGIVEGCIIYPMNETSTPENRNTLGKLGIPIRIDQASLNAMPNNQKYFMSVQFLEWQGANAKINPELSSYAENLVEKDKKAGITYKADHSSNISTRGYFDIVADASIYLEYKTTSTIRYDSYDKDFVTVTAPNPYGIAENMQDILNDDYRVIDALVNHQMMQRLKIYIEFNEYMSMYEFKQFMSDAMRTLSASYYDRGTVAFSSYYTFSYHIHKNNTETTGEGSNGISEVRSGEGGTHDEGSSTPDIPKEKPSKTPIIDCNDATELQNTRAINTLGFLDKVKTDSSYPQYINYSDYLNAVNQRDTLEHTTSLLEFDTPDGEKLYRCTPVKTGTHNKVFNDTSSASLAAIIHNHPNGTPPSFQDAIATAAIASDSSKDKFQGCLIYNAQDKSYYMIQITDKAKAKLFYREYSQEVDSETNWIKENGKLQPTLNVAKKSFKKMSDNEKVIYTLALIFYEKDAGMTLIQMDTLRQSSMYYCNDIDSNKKYITPLKCIK